MKDANQDAGVCDSNLRGSVLEEDEVTEKVKRKEGEEKWDNEPTFFC